MARRQSKARQFLFYAVVRLLAGLLRVLPLPAAAALGGALGSLVGRLDARHLRRAADQMLLAYDGRMSEAEALRNAREMYRHFGVMAAEFVRLPLVTRETLGRYLDWRGGDRVMLEAKAAGKGLIMVSGHIGHWEVGGAGILLVGASDGAVARPLDNPWLNRWVRSLREGSGQGIWDKFGVLRTLVGILRKGGGFGLLVDQDAGPGGEFVPFFGRPASTVSTHVDLALKYGTPLMAGAVHRDGKPMKFVFRWREPRWPDLDAEPAAERQRLLRLLNEDLESIIREAPEQWLWMHRRWRTRPPGGKQEESAAG